MESDRFYNSIAVHTKSNTHNTKNCGGILDVEEIIRGAFRANGYEELGMSFRQGA
jgi:hypothetical protein